MSVVPVALGRALQILTASKAFDERGLIGSARLNRLGLHAARVEFAYALSQRRRARLGARLDAAERAAFDRDGFVVRRDFLPATLFAQLVQQVRDHRTEVSERAEGSTLLRKIPVDNEVLAAIPALTALLDDPTFRALLAYGEAHTLAPSVYLQTVVQGASAASEEDPQCVLHRDTFHPTVKAWLYLTDVPREVGPLCYVRGSHRLTPGRLAWEKEKSLLAAQAGDDVDGSFRIAAEELRALGYAAPESLAVPANTLVVADTFGFHARGRSTGRTTRVEVWAIGRRRPFVALGLDRWLQKLARPSGTTSWEKREASAYDRDNEAR